MSNTQCYLLFDEGGAKLMTEKVVLNHEMETLLIPLYGRAKMTELGIIGDAYAIETMQKIEYDFGRLNVPKKTQVFMAIRSGLLDDYVNDFLSQNKSCRIISLGSGLDARYLRVQKALQWIDLDFPEVIQLRKKLLPEQQNHKMIGSSVNDLNWLNQITETDGKTLVIAEGLFMYLSENDICGLFKAITDKFTDVTLIFDAFSKLTTAKVKTQSSLKKTGATIQWGINEPDEVTALCHKLHYQQTLFLTEPKYVNKLGCVYRTMFRLAGGMRVAREAHRIFVFCKEP